MRPEGLCLAVLADLDLKTILVTLAIAPLLLFVIRRTAGFVKGAVAQVLDAIFYLIGRVFSRRILTRTSLRQYCRAGLEKSLSKYLHVPGRTMTPIATDKIFVNITLEDASRAAAVSDLASLSGIGRFRVIGDPGSGKTSVVKNHFRH